jgi:hypothetical protein
VVNSDGELSGDGNGLLLATVNNNVSVIISQDANEILNYLGTVFPFLPIIFNQVGTVCDDHFSDLSASAICQEMGYTYEGSWSHGNLWPDVQNEHTITLDNVICQTESFGECSYATTHNCGHGEDVFLNCGRCKQPIYLNLVVFF